MENPNPTVKELQEAILTVFNSEFIDPHCICDTCIFANKIAKAAQIHAEEEKKEWTRIEQT